MVVATITSDQALFTLEQPSPIQLISYPLVNWTELNMTYSSCALLSTLQIAICHNKFTKSKYESFKLIYMVAIQNKNEWDAGNGSVACALLFRSILIC